MSARNPDAPLAGIRLSTAGLTCAFSLVFGDIAAHAKPEEQLPVSHWAEAHRVVAASSGSAAPGPWINARTPYLREPQDACQLGNGVRRVVLTGGAQFGKSEVSLNAIAWAIHYMPCKILLLQPSLGEVQQYSRNKWEPMIEETPALRERVHLMKSRSTDGSTTAVKKFIGGDLEFITAGSSKGLQGRTARLVVAEECAQYEADEDGNVGVGGDAITAAEARQETWKEDAKTILVSTPGYAGRCRITAEYNLSDMRRWFTPCVHCGDAFVLDIRTLHLHEGRACMLCPSCGVVLEESDRTAMNAKGFWLPTFAHEGEDADAQAKRARNPAPPKIVPAGDIDALAPFDPALGYRFAVRNCEGRARGYHLWQGQSELSSWGVVLDKKTKFEAGLYDPKEYAQKVLGEPYEEVVDRPDSDRLFDHRGVIYPREGVVPPWVAMLTGFIDVQANRFEWGVYGWGRGGVGVRIAKGVIAKSPHDAASWQAIAQLVRATFSGPAYRARTCDYWGIDLGGTATDEVYNFVLLNKSLNVLALKGASHDGGLAPAYERGKKKRVFWKGRYQGTLIPIITGTHGLKTRVYHALLQGVESARQKQLLPRSLHFGMDATKTDFQQLTAEHLEQPDPRRKGRWVLPPGKANEQLDIAVGSLALAIMEGLDLLDEEGWTLRHSERLPALAEQDLAPLEVIMHGKAGDLPPDDAATEGGGDTPVDLTPPPAEGAPRPRLDEAAKERLREMGRKAWAQD